MKRLVGLAAFALAAVLVRVAVPELAGAGRTAAANRPLPQKLGMAGGAGGVQFRNVAAQSGVDFVLQNHPTPEKHVIETMAGGVAAFDYDGDGLVDLFFANGASVPSLRKELPRDSNRLYRNLGGMRFRDVTVDAGLVGQGFSNGAAAADYDNDGHVDLFVTGVRSNHLYRNLGNGRFADMTAKAGLRSGDWAIAAAWLDYDRDGLLDLFVVNYLAWDPANEPWCGDRAAGIRAYCHPRFYGGLANTLYRNRGDGTFADVSTETGITGHIGKGMSVAVADYDLDGYPDIFVTNDKVPNFLFHNLAGRRFEEVSLEAGTSLAAHGKEISAMGADFRDYDNDGLPDVAVAALAGELYPLFRNVGKGQFRDVTYTSRVGPLTYNRSGWGPGLFDFNNDGWKDLFVTQSHVNDTVEHFERTKYKLPNLLLLNREGSFVDASAGAGADFQVARAHRGSAFADLNNDGKIDVVVSSLGEPAEVWENVSPSNNTWLEVKLTGTKSNRDGIGARVRAGNQWNHMTTSVGYTSSSHAGVHFGTGTAATVDVTVEWPSGAVQTLRGVKTNQLVQVRE